MSIHLLGIRIDTYSKEKTLSKVAEFLQSNQQHTIFTPNPEMLVDAAKDTYFKTVLNSSSLNICDGKGIELLARGQVERFPGVDLMLAICQLAGEKKHSIYLLGSNNETILTNLLFKLKFQFPQLKITGSDPGPTITMKQRDNSTITEIDREDNEQIITNITRAAPDILFVAFGHNKQEKWIAENLNKLPSVKIVMGVGGAFDYLSGKTTRAPRRWQKLGVEWLWRLSHEPKRFGRIFKATIIFIIYYIRGRFY